MHRLVEALQGPRETTLTADVATGTLDLDGWMEEGSRVIPVAAFTDCKSLYDHVKSRSSPTAGLADPRTGLVFVAVKEAISRMQAEFRWIPSALMIADALTKVSDGDFLRHLMKGGGYQIQSEEEALRDRAKAKEERLERGARRARESRNVQSDQTSELTTEEEEETEY